MEEKKEKKGLLKELFIIFVIFMLFGGFITLLYDISKLPIVTVTEELSEDIKQMSFEGEIRTEYNKEDTYWVKFSDKTVIEVTKEDYDKYVRDFNSTTVTTYTLTLKGKKDFILFTGNMPTKTYTKRSYVFKPEKNFTKKEIKELKKLYGEK